MFAELGMYLYQIDYADNLLDSGVPEEQAEGIRLLRKLAGFGNPDAQCRLGACYLKGTGVPADKAEGVKWLRKAAEKRDTSAMRRLSECLRTGDPPTSWFEAFQWSIRADAYPLYDSITEYLFHQVKNAAENAWDNLRRH
jgi:TPR repeat protein